MKGMAMLTIQITNTAM